MRSEDIIKAFKNSPKYENYNLVFNFQRKESTYFIVQCEIDNDTLFITECRKCKVYIAIGVKQVDEYVKYILGEKVICFVDNNSNTNFNLTNKILTINDDSINLLDTKRYEIKNKHIIDKDNEISVPLNNYANHFHYDNVYFSVIFQDMRDTAKI